MPKDKRVSSVSSLDRRFMSCPYSKISELTNSPHSGNEKDWEEARCPICMEHPHNPVLLICSSREKGCRPFICDTSYRHSNCFDQLQKLAPSQSQVLCPLCRGTITGKEVISPARILMNSKTRNCSLETCDFNGNYAELRKHARRAHPYGRPSEATPSRKSDWAELEQQTEMGDVLVHQSLDRRLYRLLGLSSFNVNQRSSNRRLDLNFFYENGSWSYSPPSNLWY